MVRTSSPLDAAIQLSSSVILKYRKYVSSPDKAPKGAHVQHGKHGGLFYETSSRGAGTDEAGRGGHRGAPQQGQQRQRPTPQRDRQRPAQPVSERSHRTAPQKTQTPDPAHWDPKTDGDTEAVWRNPDGTWKPERQRLHRKILAEIFRGVPSVENPTLYLMGGGSGAGKSSVIKTGAVAVPNPTQGAHIDADAIKGMLPEWKGLLDSKNTAAAAICHEESSYLSKMALRMAADRSTHAVLDGTGDSTVPQLAKKVAEFRDRGMRVTANYVSLPTELALKNVEARGQKTGRFVPPSVVKQIHRDVSRVFPDALKAGLFDECNLYDNTIKDHPRLVLTHKDGQTQVHDEQLWREFIDKGKDESEVEEKAILAKARRYISDPLKPR